MATNFPFGAKTTPAPAFGSTTLSFGGAPSQQPTGLTFGASAPLGGTLFGTPNTAAAPTTVASLFGNTQTPGLFSAQAPTASAAPSLSFGASNSFGTPSTFGAPPNSSFAAPPAAATTTSATGFSFGRFGGSVTTAAPPSFGLSAPAATTAQSSFGFGLGNVTASNTGGLSFPSAPPATSTSSSGLNFGGFGGTPAAAATSTSAPVVGLGGIPNQLHQQVAVAKKDVPPKEQTLPNEILQNVENFKSMVKQQKLHSSEITRCSIRDYRRVEQSIDSLNNQLNEIEKQLQKIRQMAEKLKYDTAKTVQDVEMAQRTHDTLPGLQFENTAPFKFFLNLADQFENDMHKLKMHIESVERYNKCQKNPEMLTSQDLNVGMKKLHQTFVALAGQLQTVHNKVESQKEQYLALRRQLFHDNSNPFEKLVNKSSIKPKTLTAFVQPKVATGPTPFNNFALRNITGINVTTHPTPAVSSSSTSSSMPTNLPPAYPGQSSSFGAGFGTAQQQQQQQQPSNTSLFGSNNNNNNNNTFAAQNTLNNSFQLQKPPTGNKRGKM